MKTAERVWEWFWALAGIPFMIAGYAVGRICASIVASIRLGWMEAMHMISALKR